VTETRSFLHSEGSPGLPEEVILHLLGQVDHLADQAGRMLGPVVSARKELRRALIEDEDPPFIVPVPDTSAGKRLAAVDGASVHQPLYAADLMMSVAVAAEGLTPARELAGRVVCRQWSRMVRHDIDLDRLGKAAMMAAELSIAVSLPHDIVILDGSHQTPVVIFHAALSSLSEQVRTATIEVCEELDVVENLARLCDDQKGARIIACPKSDSSTDLAERMRRKHGVDILSNDKFLATMLLQPGEMTRPVAVPRSWERLRVRVPENLHDPQAAALANALDEASGPLRIMDEPGRNVGLFYVKPHGASTAVKVEFKRHHGRDYGGRLACSVSAETPAPHFQEPFCQWLADAWAKSIGPASEAALQGLTMELAGRGAGDYIEFLLRSYRSYGE